MIKRDRFRYLALKLECEGNIPKTALIESIYYSILRLFGIYGLSHCRISLIEYAPDRKYAILRCRHKAIDLVRAALASITKINDEEVSVRILLVSGTIRALKRKMVEKHAIVF